MTDENTTASPADRTAAPTAQPSPGFFAKAEAVAISDAERVIAAVERWYAAHFHAAAVAGRAPITADDKAALLQHVADAVAPTAPKE